jgi:hypothetical protein
MKNGKSLVSSIVKTGVLTGLVLGLGLGLGSVADAAPPDQVRLCHHEAKESLFPASNWHVIEVSEKAVAAHLNHGDATVFGEDEDGSCLPD